MPRTLKVYGWLGTYPEGMERPADMAHRVQARCVVAASSVSEVLRISGLRASSRGWISETGNVAEIEAAMSKPGQVFYKDDLNYTPGDAPYLEHPTQGGWQR